MITQELTTKELFYDSIAGHFDNVMNQYEVSKRLSIIFNKILKDSIQEKTFLDVGCGTGIFSKAAADRGARVTSLDLGEQLLAEVAKKCKSTRVQGDATKLPFKNNSFDIVISTEVVEHTSNPKKAVSELCRVVKPGGILIVTMPNKIWKFSVAVANFFHIRPYHAYENWLWWGELKQMLEKNNVRIVQSYGFNFIPFFHPLLQPLITLIDSFGKLLSPLMVNMVFVVEKKNEITS